MWQYLGIRDPYALDSTLADQAYEIRSELLLSPVEP